MSMNIERTKAGVDGLIDRTRDAVVGMADRAERGIDARAKDVAEQAHVAGGYVREHAEMASQGAHRRVDDSVKMIDRGLTRARGVLSQLAADAKDYATENPGKVLLFVASAAFLFGAVISRRRQTAC